MLIVFVVVVDSPVLVVDEYVEVVDCFLEVDVVVVDDVCVTVEDDCVVVVVVLEEDEVLDEYPVSWPNQLGILGSNAIIAWKFGSGVLSDEPPLKLW